VSIIGAAPVAAACGFAVALAPPLDFFAAGAGLVLDVGFFSAAVDASALVSVFFFAAMVISPSAFSSRRL
jgi:hypothetical protein